MNFKTSFISKIEKSNADLYLVSAEDGGIPCWHYLQPDKLKLPLFLQKMSQAPCLINLEEYGKVAFSGWGKEPKEEIRQQIENGIYSIPVKEADYKIMWLNNEQDGKKFHAFVAVKWELAEKFEFVANHMGNMNLEEWGTVLEIGWGNAPQEKIEYYSKLETA